MINTIKWTKHSAEPYQLLEQRFVFFDLPPHAFTCTDKFPKAGVFVQVKNEGSKAKSSGVHTGNTIGLNVSLTSRHHR